MMSYIVIRRMKIVFLTFYDYCRLLINHMSNTESKIFNKGIYLYIIVYKICAFKSGTYWNFTVIWMICSWPTMSNLLWYSHTFDTQIIVYSQHITVILNMVHYFIHTNSGTPDLTPFEEFLISPIHYRCTTKLLSLRTMFMDEWLWFVCLG